MIRYRNMLSACAFACSLAVPLNASVITLIDANTQNGSFETVNGCLNTSKVKDWDNSPIGDVDYWTQWTEQTVVFGDSGVEQSAYATHGNMVGFLQHYNAIYNMSSHIVAEGDVFTFQWDHVFRDQAHTVSLVYNHYGTIKSLDPSAVTSVTVANDRTGTYTVQAGDQIIGSTVGLGVKNNNSSYPEVDNFRLSVDTTNSNPGSIPEPASLAMLSVGSVLLLRRNRRR